MVDEGVETLVNILVEDFHVTVGLWVVGGQELLFDPCKLVELIHEGRDELRSSVRSDGLRGAIDLPGVLIV